MVKGQARLKYGGGRMKGTGTLLMWTRGVRNGLYASDGVERGNKRGQAPQQRVRQKRRGIIRHPSDTVCNMTGQGS